MFLTWYLQLIAASINFMVFPVIIVGKAFVLLNSATSANPARVERPNIILFEEGGVVAGFEELR